MCSPAIVGGATGEFVNLSVALNANETAMRPAHIFCLLLLVRTLTFVGLQLASHLPVDSRTIHHQKVQDLSFLMVYRSATNRQTGEKL